MPQRAILSLETGEHFFGYAHGSGGEVGGEVVFNTSMTGYQEITTDPSYRGQIVVLAYPLINNYGANRQDPESRRPWLAGLVVREHAERASNWRNQQPLSEYLSEFGIPVLSGIDTRRLVRILRSGGVRKGLLSRVEGDVADCDRFAWITGRAVFPDGYLVLSAGTRRRGSGALGPAPDRRGHLRPRVRVRGRLVGPLARPRAAALAPPHRPAGHRRQVQHRPVADGPRVPG